MHAQTISSAQNFISIKKLKFALIFRQIEDFSWSYNEYIT